MQAEICCLPRSSLPQNSVCWAVERACWVDRGKILKPHAMHPQWLMAINTPKQAERIIINEALHLVPASMLKRLNRKYRMVFNPLCAVPLIQVLTDFRRTESLHPCTPEHPHLQSALK